LIYQGLARMKLEYRTVSKARRAELLETRKLLERE
jgi:hypothetical protein